MPSETPPARTTPFHELSDYLAIPRVTALRRSPDGGWLAASVQTLSSDKKKYVTSIWRIDAEGGPPRRLTRSAEGEGSPRFLPDGSLLFTSKRPAPGNGDGKDGKNGNHEESAALWLLPAGGGEAYVAATLPGGITGLETAADTPATVVVSPVLGDDDERLRKDRKDAGVTAILHETVPTRYWDHDLGPAEPRLFAVTVGAQPDNGAGPACPGARAHPADPVRAHDAAFPARDLTPGAGRALFKPSFALSPDGTQVAAGWWRWRDGVLSNEELVLIDLATGNRTVLLADPDLDYDSPAFSPDGRYLACVRSSHLTPEAPHGLGLVLVPVGEPAAARELAADLDRWPAGPVWDPAGRRVFFAADDGGRRPVFGVDIGTGTVTRITTDHGHYSELNPSQDGTALFALRAAVDAPPAPAVIDLTTGQVRALAGPAGQPRLPGRLTEVTADADDGHPVRGWLVLPETASTRRKAPLLLWVHGGPMNSWNYWSWRWNPWLMAARGYAVLLPDPALSTGYGQDFIARGHRHWGPRPYQDVLAVTDASIRRDDIDEHRTAVMGGSYGGYLANWIAGHTDRFKAIVSHAGLWALDQMFGTTDVAQEFRRQWGDPLTEPAMYEENSPHLHAAKITTPMLVIHGNQDYRVPLSEALRLWNDLSRHRVEAKFLYFPDENHWVLSPGNATIWYETVFAFLACHVLGEPWRRPALL